MAVTVAFYNPGKVHLGAGCNLSTGTFQAIPLTNTYTFSAAHQYASSLTNEVTTNGGTRVTLTTTSWALSGSNARFDCDDLAWTAAGGSLTIRKVAIVDYTGTPADAALPLICLLTSDADLTAGVSTQVKILTPNGLFEFQ